LNVCDSALFINPDSLHSLLSISTILLYKDNIQTYIRSVDQNPMIFPTQQRGHRSGAASYYNFAPVFTEMAFFARF
jgi:hypothetical protein